MPEMIEAEDFATSAICTPPRFQKKKGGPPDRDDIYRAMAGKLARSEASTAWVRRVMRSFNVDFALARICDPVNSVGYRDWRCRQAR
jgi:hypothetical protein